MFRLNSRVTVGGFRFTGVHDVRIKKALNSYIDTCVIALPSLARVKKSGAPYLFGLDRDSRGLVTTGNQFSVGDGVKVELGYNGRYRTEFEGFLTRKNIALPMELECEGYGRELRLNNDINGFLKKTDALELLEVAVGIKEVVNNVVVLKAVPRTDIKVICDEVMPIVNIRMTHASGAMIVDEIKKISLGTMVCFFISPKVLWCGLKYTPYQNGTDQFGVGEVKYRMGYNCIRDNRLKERNITEPVQVLLSGSYADGSSVQTRSEAEYAVKKTKAILNNVPSGEWPKKIANEKQYQANYVGFEGSLTGFLDPYCAPGYVAKIADSRYPNLNGRYMVEATEVRFGMGGGRRIVDIGPKIGV